MNEIEEIIAAAVMPVADAMFEEEDELRVVRERGPWVKVNIDVDSFRRMADPTFQMHFRMNKPTFEILVTAVGNHLNTQKITERLRTPIDVALFMALWMLANPDTFRSTALTFNTSPGVVRYHYLVVIKALTEMAPTYVTWPTAFERERIKENFERKSGFPGVVGCIDGTHLFISAPCEDSLSYLNRHHAYSVLAQVVSDDDFLVRDLYVGEPGSLHDSRVFRRSPLSENLLTNPNVMADDEHLLGDGAYILTAKLLVPYRNNGNLSPAQLYFNRMLSKIRATVERLFGLAKGKWRRMKNFESHDIKYAVQHIVASFVLHNFLILRGQQAPQDRDLNVNNYAADMDWQLEEEVDPEGDYPNVQAEPDHPLLAAARAAGAVKRRVLTHYFQTPAPSGWQHLKNSSAGCDFM